MQPTPWWLLATVPAFLISTWLLVRTIRSLIRTTQRSVVASVPLQGRQTLALPEAGAYDLFVEGKRMSRDFAGLDFALEDGAGASIPLNRFVVRTTVSGISRVRVKVRGFRLHEAGPVTLSIQGIREGSDAENRLVFGRPFLGALVVHVLALVVLGASTIGALVGTILVIVLGRGAGGS